MQKIFFKTETRQYVQVPKLRDINKKPTRSSQLKANPKSNSTILRAQKNVFEGENAIAAHLALSMSAFKKTFAVRFEKLEAILSPAIRGTL